MITDTRILEYQKVPFPHGERNIKQMGEIFQSEDGVIMKVTRQKKMQDSAKN